MLFAKTSTLQRTLFSTMKDAITWKLNKQPITASSSTTAEHIALNEVTRESMVLSQILTSMGTPLQGPVPILHRFNQRYEDWKTLRDCLVASCWLANKYNIRYAKGLATLRLLTPLIEIEGLDR